MSKSFSIIGHRGAMGHAPENSIESIRKAMQLGVDEIEIDARLKSGVVILSHDKPTPSGIYCPLKQALKEIAGKVPVVIEIKELAAVKHLPEALGAYDGKIVFSSFKFSVLQRLKSLIPEANVAVLEKWSGVRAVAEASLLNTRRIHMNEKWLWVNFAKSMKREGYELYAYTVNSQERADELKSWGVKGVFTDYPDRFMS